MTTLTESIHTGEYLLSEGNGAISREQVVIAGGDYPAGQVLGIITASGKYTAHDPAAADGSEVAAAILYGPVDASVADADGVITARLAEVNDDLLTWKAGISAPDKAAGIATLATNDIYVRR
jgi:hypothetical protein